MSEMLQPGTHRVKVTNVSYSQREGSPPQLAIRFEDDMGEGISWYHALGYLKDGSWSEKSFQFAADQLKNLGVALNSDTDFVALGQPDVSPLMGVECDIVVVNETYEGETRTKVKYINDPNRAPGGERMEASAAQSWQEQLRAKLRAAGKGPTGPAPARKAPAPAKPPAAKKPAEDKDINWDEAPF